MEQNKIKSLVEQTPQEKLNTVVDLWNRMPPHIFQEWMQQNYAILENTQPTESKTVDDAAKAYVKTLKGIGYRSLYDFGTQNLSAFKAGWNEALKQHQPAKPVDLSERPISNLVEKIISTAPKKGDGSEVVRLHIKDKPAEVSQEFLNRHSKPAEKSDKAALECGRCGKTAEHGKIVGSHCSQYHDSKIGGFFCSGTIIERTTHPVQGEGDLETLALSQFIPERNKYGELKTMVPGQKNPHGSRKFINAWIKGYKYALQQHPSTSIQWLTDEDMKFEAGRHLDAYYGKRHKDFVIGMKLAQSILHTRIGQSQVDPVDFLNWILYDAMEWDEGGGCLKEEYNQPPEKVVKIYLTEKQKKV